MQRPVIDVHTATANDRTRVAGVLARAFVNDPVMCYLFPDEADRPRKLDQFFDLVVHAEGDPTDTLIAGDGGAVTVWRKPGEWRTPPAAMIRLAWPLLRIFGLALPRALRVQSLLERHHPQPLHWYLEFAGSEPARRGRGFGGAAIRARLRETDAAGLATALETANPANLSIYGALGYVVTGSFAVTPNLQFWTMWRAVPS